MHLQRHSRLHVLRVLQPDTPTANPFTSLWMILGFSRSCFITIFCPPLLKRRGTRYPSRSLSIHKSMSGRLCTCTHSLQSWLPNSDSLDGRGCVRGLTILKTKMMGIYGACQKMTGKDACSGACRSDGPSYQGSGRGFGMVIIISLMLNGLTWSWTYLINISRGHYLIS